VAPLIGVTTSVYTNPENGWEYNRAYVPIMRSIADAGGLPF